MRHDARDDGGMYRPLSAAEERCERAKHLTQTHEGRFTHSRDAAERRMKITLEPANPPYFKDRKANRDGYHPKVTK